MKARLPLSSRIIGVFAVFVSLAVAGVGLLSYRSGRASLEAAVTAELLSVALSKQSEIDRWLGARAADVAVISGEESLNRSLRDRANVAAAEAVRAADASLQSQLQAHVAPSTWRALAVVDPVTGRILAGTGPAAVGASLADQPIFLRGKAGLSTQGLYYSRELREPAMAIAAPMRTPQGRLLAVLVGWPNLTQLHDIVLERSGLHETDDAYLVNGARHYVTQPRLIAEPVVLTRAVETAAVARSMAGNSGVLLGADYRGQPAIVVYRWLPAHKLALIAKIDQAEAFAPVEAFGRTVALMTLLLLLAAIIGAAMLARTITRPLLAFQAGVARFGRGELELPLAPAGSEELAELAREFNKMAAAITDKEQALAANAAMLETRVRERTQVLQQQANLLELSHEAIIVRAVDGQIRFWNMGAQEMYGWNAGEVAGQTTHGLLGTRPEAAVPAMAAQLHATDRWEGELTHTRRDGKQLLVASRQALQRDERGLAIAILEINSDVTEQRRAERELRRFFDLSLDLLCIASFDGYFIRLNPAWETVLGYSVAELCASQFLEFVHPEDRTATLRSTERLKRGLDVASFENRYRCRDGSYRWLLWQATASDASPYIYATARDITERRMVLEQLQAAKESAEQATRAKSEFLANMSHEIRTPMNGVIGLASLMRQTSLTGQQREYLDLLMSSADSLLRLLNDILDVSKLEAEKLALDAVAFDLREMLGTTLKAFATTANEKRLELTYEVLPEVPQMLRGDPGRLNQILVNLVGNALKFTHSGEVVVRVELQDLRDDRATLRFRVCDTGIGIDRGKLAAIFDPFSQADTSTTREYGGTGLGLAIVAKLVALMGGAVTVESEPGQGATFAFSIVLEVLPQQAGPVRVSDVTGLRQLPVLVVDDNASNRMILERILRSWDMRPVLASSAEEALAELARAAAANAPFALALLDSRMPRMDGFELAEAILSNREFASPTLMMLSSSDVLGEIERCKALGIASHLRKPVKQSELFDAIVSALHSSLAGAEVEHASAATDAPARRLKVLVVEDHPINQRLVTEILRLRGHDSVPADNGIEALRHLAEQSFDVILMDGQMPEMDGYQATAVIRSKELATGEHIRIIGVTAHAMKGDRENCLAIGMDDYLAKPIDADQLIRLVEADPATGPSPQPSPPRRSAPATGVFDPTAALKRARGKPALLAQMVEVFLRELPIALDGLQAALDVDDADQLERLAHRLRGAASTVAAVAVAKSAGQLEDNGRASSNAQRRRLFARLQADADALSAAMRDFNRRTA